jgi:hypothetical protein
MPTFLWIVYDIVLGIAGFWSLDRALTRNERFGLALLMVAGLGLATYSGYSDYADSQRIANLEQQVGRLSNGQAFNTGQLNAIGRMNGATLDLLAGKTSLDPSAGPDAVAKAAAKKIDDLAKEVEGLKRQAMEGEWPALDADQSATLRATFKAIVPASFNIACNESDCRKLAESIRDAATASGLQSRILDDTVAGSSASGMLLYGPDKKRDSCDRVADTIKTAVKFPVIVHTEKGQANAATNYNLIIGRKPRIEDIVVGEGSAPPTTGSFREGDIWRNAQPKPGGTLGWIWVCDDSGKCAWNAYGPISL